MAKIMELPEMEESLPSDLLLFDNYGSGTKAITLNKFCRNMMEQCDRIKAHRVMWRGGYLGDTFAVGQQLAINDGTFNDIFVGDYWVINGRTYTVLDVDYYRSTYNATSDMAEFKHHLLMGYEIPISSIIGNQPMLSSTLWDTVQQAENYISEDFNNKILKHKTVTLKEKNKSTYYSSFNLYLRGTNTAYLSPKTTAWDTTSVYVDLPFYCQLGVPLARNVVLYSNETHDIFAAQQIQQRVISGFYNYMRNTKGWCREDTDVNGDEPYISKVSASKPIVFTKDLAAKVYNNVSTNIDLPFVAYDNGCCITINGYYQGKFLVIFALGG